MENFQKGKKYIIIILSLFLVWILISIYWYVCIIKGFCSSDSNFQKKTTEIVKTQEVKSNTVKEKIVEDESFVKKIIPENKREDVVVNKKIIKTKTETIRCMTYLNSDIKPNSKNNFNSEVRKLEEFLNNYFEENLKIDGVYDIRDIEAVKRFQEKNDIKQDGLVGQNTRKIINVLYCIKNKDN